jgi:hypothetical protein
VLTGHRCAAGLPNDNDTVYCPVNQSSCYISFDSFTYPQAKAKCAAAKGYVVSWDEAEEQLQIENYYRVRMMRCAMLLQFSSTLASPTPV